MTDFREDCIFCKIVRGDFGTELVADNDAAVAFRDLHPQAPTHVLIVSRIHLENIVDLVEFDSSLASRLTELAVEVAKKEGVVQNGFRLLTNTGSDAGQSVQHVHFHVIGGVKLGVGLA
jgi:histidine triad (HIT) family protein